MKGVHMPTIGMPKVKIAFESAGLAAIQRSARGIVLLLIKSSNPDEQGEYKLNSLFDLDEKTQFDEETIKYIRLAFKGKPNKVIAQVYGEANPLTDVMNKLRLVKFNYYAAPNATDEELEKLKTWHSEMVDTKDRTIKFVGYNYQADDETVINWVVPRVTFDGKDYTGQEFTTLIASQLAALPLSRSFTYFTWPELTDAELPYADDEDKAVNEGKLFLTYNGENYKIARGVNSLTTYSDKKGEDFSKIKIVDSMHMIKDDIRDTWEEFYVGKYRNTYANKMQFLALVNRVYFRELEGEILEPTSGSRVDIDVRKNEMYAVKRGANIDEMTEQQIREFNTGSNLFAAGYVSILDAMEDLYINFRNE